jgi:hypothetical protein
MARPIFIAGRIGVGIDMGEGLTLKGVHRSRIVTHHPDTHKPVTGIQVPYRENMLLIAARTGDMTGLLSELLREEGLTTTPVPSFAPSGAR